MKAADASHPDALPRAYAAWRCRTLAGAIVATAVGLVVQGPTGEFRADFAGEWPSPWLLLGLVAVVVGSFGPGMVGAGLALAAVWSWRRLGTSSRLARAAWVLWVLGPLPVLLLPVAHLFNLNLEDSLKTSATQVRYLVTVIAPALFALLPGTLRAALILERFLPESRASGQITLLAAPACTVAYLLPLAVLTQLAFHWGLYLGLLLLASSPLVPLLAGIIHSQSLCGHPIAVLPKMHLERRLAASKGTPPPCPQAVSRVVDRFIRSRNEPRPDGSRRAD